MKFNNREQVYFFLIDREIFQRLKSNDWKNGKLRYRGQTLKFDMVCFYINLISYRAAISKNISTDGYVYLKAEILEKYHHAYKKYMDFMEEHKFIKVRTYSIIRNKSKSYKLVRHQEAMDIIKYIPRDFTLRKKLSKDFHSKKEEASKTTGHLTKWLQPEYLKIDYEESIEYLKNAKLSNTQKYSRRYLIEMIKHERIYFQREGKDNRLHSTITNLPKDLRHFISFKGKEKLFSLDLKSSQPFFLAGLLHLLSCQSTERDLKSFPSSCKESSLANNYLSDRILQCLNSIKDREIRKRICSSLSTMIWENEKPLDITGVTTFIDLVVRSDLYEYIGRRFSKDFLYRVQTSIGVSDQFYNQNKEYKEWIHFSSLRDYVKIAVMEFLYSSPLNKERRCREIRRILPPVVSEVIDRMKKENKNQFPIFMQNLEASLIVDRITRKLTEQHPDMPLFTIHDSIATTKHYVPIVEQFIKDELQEFFGISPRLSIEHWTARKTDKT